MYITFNPQIKSMALNRNINNSYFNRSMSSDCVEISFKRKKKDPKVDLVKDICKFGFKENEVLKVLSNTKSQNKINEYIQTNGNNAFNRELSLGEIFISVANEFTEDETNKYLKLNDLNIKGKTPFARLLKTKEVINIVKNIEVEDVPRYLELVDNNKNGEPFLSDRLNPAKVFNCIYYDFDDIQAETYLQLSDADFFLFSDIGYNYDLGPMDIQFVSNKQNCEDYLYLTSENASELFSRPLNYEEAIAIASFGFDNKQIQTYIDYIDSNDEKNNTSKLFTRPIHFMEAIQAIKENCDVEKTQKFLNIIDGFDFYDKDFGSRYWSPAKIANEAIDLIRHNCNQEMINEYNSLRKYSNSSKSIMKVFSSEEKYSRFKLLQQKDNNITNCPMNFANAFEMVDRDFDDEKIKMFEFITLPENNHSPYYAFNLFNDEKRYAKFLNLKNNPPKEIERELTGREILYCIDNKLKTDEIKEIIDLVDCFGTLEMAEQILEFVEYKDVQSIDELNLTRRRDLLKKIIKLNKLVKPEQKDKNYISNKYKIIPKTEEQFNNIIKELFLSIGINDITPIKSGQKEFINSIQSIAQQVKTTDIDKIDINKLSLPQTSKLIDNLNNDKQPLKVLKNIVNNPEFNKLSEADKNILIMSSLLVNIAKSDEKNPKLKEDSAFEAYYISKSLGFSEDDSFKIFTMIANNNWYEEIKNAEGRQQEILYEDTAFNLRYGNTLELSKLFCKANSIENGINNVEFNSISNGIIEKLNVIKSSQIILPQTKIPKASQVKNIETLSADGITNKVLYMDSANEDLSIYGFEDNVTKDNFRILIHCFDNAKNLFIVNSLNVVDNDSVLCASYISPDEYRAFRNIGLVLDVDSDNINAAYWRDFGSGMKKTTERIKREYIFPPSCEALSKYEQKILRSISGRYPETRSYISDLIKEELQLSDEEYISKIDKIRNCKSLQDIEKEDKSLADMLTPVFNKVGLGNRRGGRRYNEVLVSQRKFQGAFAYDKKYEDIPVWMRKYAQDNDLLLIIFGEKEPL